LLICPKLFKSITWDHVVPLDTCHLNLPSVSEIWLLPALSTPSSTLFPLDSRCVHSCPCYCSQSFLMGFSKCCCNSSWVFPQRQALQWLPDSSKCPNKAQAIVITAHLSGLLAGFLLPFHLVLPSGLKPFLVLGHCFSTSGHFIAWFPLPEPSAPVLWWLAPGISISGLEMQEGEPPASPWAHDRLISISGWLIAVPASQGSWESVNIQVKIYCLILQFLTHSYFNYVYVCVCVCVWFRCVLYTRESLVLSSS
jgi:hypothetical protein